MPRAKSISPLAWGLLAVCLLASAGCFDYSLELGLTEKGAGHLEVKLDLPEVLAGGYPMGHLDTVVFPPAQRSRLVNNGRLVISERGAFENLDELAARRVFFEVVEIGTGLAGLGSYTYRVRAHMQMAEGDLPDREVLPGRELVKRSPDQAPQDPAAQRARQLRARSLAGHYLTVAFVFPGRVEKAYPLILGASQVQATVLEDGRRVAWKIPLAVLFNENWRNTLTCTADFNGRFEFRAYEQKNAVSHYPDAYDEALARGENPPGGRARYLQRLGLAQPNPPKK